MNNRRQMAGRYDDPDRPQHRQIAAVWDLRGRLLRIGLLPGEDDGFAIAEGINDAGEVAGSGSSGADGLRSFYWSRATGTRTLPIPGRQCNDFSAHAINAGGAIVGHGNQCSGHSSPAWIWTAQDGAHWLIDLVDPGDPLRDKVTLSAGFDINARGQVVVWGTAHGDYATILLTPLP